MRKITENSKIYRGQNENNRILWILGVFFMISIVIIVQIQPVSAFGFDDWFGLKDLYQWVFGSNQNVDEAFNELGISGMRIKEFDIDGNKYTKVKEEKNNIEVNSEYFNKGKGIVKQDIYINNKENKKKIIDFSTTIEIDYNKIMFGGVEYQLTSSPVKLEGYEKNGVFVVPNIFMGKENKRINFKDIAEQGGYALAYKQGDKYYIDLRIDNLNLNALEELYIDPIFVNATDGFSTVAAGAADPNGVASNGTDIWITDYIDKAIYHFKASDGSNLTHNFDWNAIGSSFPYRLWANNTDLGIVDLDDRSYYQVRIADGSNRTGIGFTIGSITGSVGVPGVTSNGTDLWFTDQTNNFVSHVYNRVNITNGFPLGTAATVLGLTIRKQNFWIPNAHFISHYNIEGINQTDGFDTSGFGSSGITDIATDNSGLWTIDNVDDFVYHFRSEEEMIVTLNSPADTSTVFLSEVEFNCSAYAEIGIINNITLWHNISGTWKSNQTLDVSGLGVAEADAIFNVSNIHYGTYEWNCEAFSSNSLSTNATLNFTFKYDSYRVNSATFNSTTFETESETFVLNITTNGSVPTARFFYNNTNKGASTVTVYGANEYLFSNTFDIKINAAVNDFYWETTIGGSIINTTIRNQTVNLTILNQCNSTLTTRYINFSFKNETDGLEDISATVSSIWTYYLGTGTINKTLSYINTTEYNNYSFCAIPNRTITAVIDLDYNNIESQQRTYSTTLTLSNFTTLKTLYLLPSSKGLFSIFRTEDNLGNILSKVKGLITRTLAGSLITITSDITDDSGVVVFFLNPDVTYTGLFTKSGFLNNEFSFVPISDTRTVIMGTGVGVINGTEIAINTTSQIFPANNSLINNTDYTFGFNVVSSQTITLISMNITNSSGDELLFADNAGAGLISGILNTGNYTLLIGTFIIKTADETLTLTKIWIVGVEFIGEYSLFYQLNLYLLYEFNDIFRYLIILGTIIAIIIFMSIGEITDTSESKIIVGILLIWIFSLVGWLNTGLLPASEHALSEFGNQYGIAILSTAAGAFFIFRRLFIIKT